METIYLMRHWIILEKKGKTKTLMNVGKMQQRQQGEFIGAGTYPRRFSTEFYVTWEGIIKTIINQKITVRST